MASTLMPMASTPMPMLDTHMPMVLMLHMLPTMLLPRGLLMLSPRLMLTTDTTDVVMDMDMLLLDALPTLPTPVPMDTDTTTDMDMVVKPHKTNKRNHSD